MCFHELLGRVIQCGVPPEAEGWREGSYVLRSQDPDATKVDGAATSTDCADAHDDSGDDEE